MPKAMFYNFIHMGAPGGTQCGNRITVVTSGTSRRTLIGESIDARRTIDHLMGMEATNPLL